MNKIYFVTGSQDLYGEETLRQAAKDSAVISGFLNEKLSDIAEVVFMPVVKTACEAEDICVQASSDKDCIGVIMWMHTFSPAKMWIRALKALKKPMLHLHTQFNEKLPYDSIDMDFMNLNQSAHGDREFGFICTRLGIKREVVVGYYRHEDVTEKIRRFAYAASAVAFSRTLRVAMLGNNMRDVAVTDGDRVESEIRFGWNVNYYGIGDVADIADSVTDSEIEAKMSEYAEKYTMATDNLAAVREQAKYETALDKFIAREKINAFTDTFQDLHGLNQLPGIAAQNLMAKGIGFGPEGDYKTAALGAVLFKMSEGRKGSTGFMEDYTYHFEKGNDLVLGSHMLEVCPSIAVEEKPILDVQHLGIGGKDDPARLIFNTQTGPAIVASLIDLGDRYRLLVNCIDTVKTPHSLPKLPVANALWKAQPDLPTASEAWILAGGAHHTVFSHALNLNDMRQFAEMHDIEITVIDNDTRLPAFKNALRWNEVYYGFRR